MDPPVPVKTLTLLTDTENLKIHGRAVRIWTAADARYGRVYNMAFLFIDHTGEKIQGIIPVPDYQRLSTVFTEENICEITRFTMDTSTIDYQVIKHPYILSLTRQTMITVLPQDLYAIPRNCFDFRSFREIGVTITHLKAVMDVIARIVGFSDVRPTNSGGTPSRVQGMYLTDNGGRTVEVALWGNYIDYFNVPELFERSKQAPVVIVCNSLQIKYWRGVYGLKTYSGTHFFLDPSLKEIADYQALIPRDGKPITLHATSETFNIHSATSSALQRTDPIKVTLQQLGSLYLDPYNENKYQSAAIIMNINNRLDWYKIRVQVVDHTWNAQFVLLGRFGEQVVGMSAQALAALQQQNNNKTPDQLLQIIGKKFLFTVAGKQRTPNQENRCYTVVNIEEIPEEMLSLLPQPILEIDAAPLIASSSAIPPQNHTYTPPNEFTDPPQSPCTPAGHTLIDKLSTGTTTPPHDDPKDTQAKRLFPSQEDAPEHLTKNVRRRLEFEGSQSKTTQSGLLGTILWVLMTKYV
ncbi:hypothetical protein LUZ63_004239 [Rhynchospora breviuscula]|uniref:Replication factor A C-terminal domain-containing protein n=1 Tax=Rhynchospora breviuscula TaxID=2022672 RepID=A0A9Q0I0C5_9POAL|nr:hypothetical protein LUZ63_005049 [Rhynchospora breviuscula]KAJ1704460.1 hypothetical protein LUZ63_004239 [Rhynchospora breviuscula]